jgi:hypothetical protein
VSTLRCQLIARARMPDREVAARHTQIGSYGANRLDDEIGFLTVEVTSLG